MPGKKDIKLPRFGLIPAYPMWEVAKVYGHGATKYAERNWEKGISFTVSLDALERHIALFKAGQSKDKESGIHHLAHAVFHCLALIQNERVHPLNDDRSQYYMALNMDSETLVRESKDFGDPDRPLLRSGELAFAYGSSVPTECDCWGCTAFPKDEEEPQTIPWNKAVCDWPECFCESSANCAERMQLKDEPQDSDGSRCDWPKCRCEESCPDYWA